MTLLDNIPRIRPSKTRYRVSDTPPADLRGKPRADRIFAVAGKLIERVYIARIENTDYDRSDAGHNPDSAMQLVLRERVVVAHDENVVRLSFGNADGSDVTAVATRLPSRFPPAVRQTSAVLHLW